MFSTRTPQVMGPVVSSSTKYRGILLFVMCAAGFAAKDVELTSFGPNMLCEAVTFPAEFWIFFRLFRAGEALLSESVEVAAERLLVKAEPFLSGRDPCDESISDSPSASDAEPS